MEAISSYTPTAPAFSHGRVDFNADRTLRESVNAQIESLIKQWPHARDVETLMVSISSDRMRLSNQQTSIEISGLDGLSQELERILDQQQRLDGQHFQKMDELSQHNFWQTSVSAVATVAGVAVAAATGGTAVGFVAAGIALLNAAHQVASNWGIYSKAGDALGKDDAEKRRVGSALQNGIGFAVAATGIATLFLGGAGAAETGLKAATEVTARGASAMATVAQGFMGVRQARLGSEKSEIDVEMFETQLKLQLRRVAQDVKTQDYETSLSSAERHVTQTAQTARVMRQITEAIANAVGG